MNSRRAGNRRTSMKKGGPDANYMASPGKSYQSHGSPASMAASVGPGPMPGAGELNAPGAFPGPAARRITGLAADEFPTRASTPGGAPAGVRTYRQE